MDLQPCFSEDSDLVEDNDEVDPINDIIDYLVRCANISFKNAHVDETEVRTGEKIKFARDIFNRSPTDFLMQFGKYMAPQHLSYFENLSPGEEEKARFLECKAHLKTYHSNESCRKRVRNRRFKALQKLQEESDYFTEKQMMYRNPLLYEQLVGQYLTDEEIRERDCADNENLTFLSMILETVDRNQMRATRNEQIIQENLEGIKIQDKKKEWSKQVKPKSKLWGAMEDDEDNSKTKSRQWGGFEKPDSTPSFEPETRKQSMISAPERRLLREEFLQEMYTSFIDGFDADVDYHSIDNDEQYDDLKQVSQDAEDRYFDSETNEVENLEEHMQLIEVYGNKNIKDDNADDPLDEFMDRIENKQHSVQ